MHVSNARNRTRLLNPDDLRTLQDFVGVSSITTPYSVSDSLKQLVRKASALGITSPVGNKRHKTTWLHAIAKVNGEQDARETVPVGGNAQEQNSLGDWRSLLRALAKKLSTKNGHAVVANATINTSNTEVLFRGDGATLSDDNLEHLSDTQLFNCHAADKQVEPPAGVLIRYNYPRSGSMVPAIFGQSSTQRTIKRQDCVLIQQFCVARHWWNRAHPPHVNTNLFTLCCVSAELSCVRTQCSLHLWS